MNTRIQGNRPAQASPAHGALLHPGAKGAAVRVLQARLAELGYNVGSADGTLGPKTEAAVRAFQHRKGLTPDGVVGGRTWAALGVKARGGSAPRPTRAEQALPAESSQRGMVLRQGEPISPKIAGKFDRMAAAARRDGVQLRIRDGHRSYRDQVRLWNKFGRDPKRVARPGHSNHQSGEAIDFRSTPGAWSWLKRNAAKFGLHNYKPEPWHYSLTGK